MNILTKSYRKNIIDNVFPSDLNKEDIKLGLKAKEELLNNITDEYVQSILPNYKEIQETISNLGITEDEYQKYMTGDLSIDKINLPKEAKVLVEIYAKHPEDEVTNIPNGWSEYKETITFQKPSTWKELKIRITISGDNFDKYYFENNPEYGMNSKWMVLPENCEMDPVEFKEESRDSNKISYITNNISFNLNGESEFSGIYLYNQWIKCDYQIPFVKIISISMTTSETY